MLRCFAILLWLPSYNSRILPCDTSLVQVSTVAGSIGLSQPSGIAISHLNIMYISDSGNNAIRAMNLSAPGSSWLQGAWAAPASLPPTYVEGALSTTARFSLPRALAYSRCSGVLYVADSLNHVVRVLQPYPTNVSTDLVAGKPTQTGSSDGIGSAASFDQPLGLALSPSCAAPVLYVSEKNSNVVRSINLVTRAVATILGSGAGASTNGIGTSATFYRPQHLALDTLGSRLVFGNFVRCVCVCARARARRALCWLLVITVYSHALPSPSSLLPPPPHLSPFYLK